MELPTIKSIVRDEKRNITYEVVAYRKLSQAEVAGAVRFFLATKKSHKVKPNMHYTIVSTIGARDPL